MAHSSAAIHFEDGDGSRVYPATQLDNYRVGVLVTVTANVDFGLYGTPDQLEEVARGILESIGRPVPPVSFTLDVIETEIELTEALTALQGALRRLRGGDGPPNTETGSPLDLSDVITLTDAGEHALAGRPPSLVDG